MRSSLCSIVACGRGVAQLFGVPFTAPGVDLVVPVLHHAIDVKHLLGAGGMPSVLRHRIGGQRRTVAELAAVAAEARAVD